jgi:hypothetical protein
MVFLRNFCVNLRACLCGAVNYASAQALDFLELGQKSSFLDWKHHQVPIILRAIYGWAPIKKNGECKCQTIITIITIMIHMARCH